MLLIFVSNKYVYSFNPIFEFWKQNIKMCVDKDVIICRKSRDNFQLFLRNFYWWFYPYIVTFYKITLLRGKLLS